MVFSAAVADPNVTSAATDVDFKTGPEPFQVPIAHINWTSIDDGITAQGPAINVILSSGASRAAIDAGSVSTIFSITSGS